MSVLLNKMIQILVSSLVFTAGIFSFTMPASIASAAPQDYPLGQRSIFSERATRERVSSLGQVCLKGESCAGASAPAAAVAEESAGGPRSGEEIYNSVCAACHGVGVMGAPKFDDKAAWTARLEKGQETLVKNAIKGINAMPANGTCRDCSPEDIAASVEYMLRASGAL